ncbi:carbon-nitrogen hydrolase family protein [Pseudalkalibacillus sp. Hm43]|uniref:carbon-nitrogen hydrolase family protein n=1 Tax=Pseudalkalibacillus sp. Hm43 TaxID=3450742 RepID=UPI003F4268A9
MNLTVWIGQFPLSFDMKANLNHIVKLMDQLDEDEVLVLPEGALSGYDDDLGFLENLDVHELQACINQLSEYVKKKKIHLIFGSCLYEEGKWYNAGIYLSPQGNREAYHKVNLAIHERGTFTAGDRLPVFEMKTNEGIVRFGIQLCREIRFPEQWKLLSMRGAQCMIYLTNVISEDHLPVWKSHLISRAAENQRYIFGSNVAHPKQGCPTIAISPKGSVLEEIVSEETIMKRVKVDLSTVSNWYIDQTRTDLLQIKEINRLNV